jgi:hypothetical protein
MLVGMVHLPPLPGAPRFAGAGAGSLPARDMCGIRAHAVRDARLLCDCGFDAVMVENFGDHPFYGDRVPAETIAAMAVVVADVVQAVGGAVGVNVLRNDARAALAIAAISGAAMIRVNVHSGVMDTDQGRLTGRAAATLRERARLGADVRILADVHVKHAVPISQPDLGEAARDTAYRGLADGLIVSGQATGRATDVDHVRRVKAAVPDRPVYVGSGVNADNAAALFAVADGLIIGTSLKREGETEGRLDRSRIRKLLKAVGRA